MKCPCVKNRNGWPLSKRRNKTGTLGAWLQTAREQLAGRDEHISVLHTLIHSVLRKPTAWQLSHPDFLLSPEQENDITSLCERLLTGEPLAYIIGYQWFYGRDFLVNSSVLIPRPETEQLVKTAINAAQSIARPIRIADVGTGSGCIAITLAAEIQRSQVIASDISFAALETASNNAKRHTVDKQVTFMHCNLMDAADQRFDIICANLPYIPQEKLQKLDVMQHEPALALDGGPDGLRLIRPLLEDLRRMRTPNCIALFEIEASHGETFLSISRSLFPAASIKIENDLAGKERIGIIQFTS